MPSLTNFRVGYVPGHVRIFNQVGMIFLRIGIAMLDEEEICGMGCVKKDGHPDMPVCIFDIPNDELPAFYEREHLYNLDYVDALEADKSTPVKGLCCLAWKDDEELVEKCLDGDHTKLAEHKIDGYDGPIYRKDLLPCRAYLKHCHHAAEQLGLGEGFLDTTLLGDEITTLRLYLQPRGGSDWLVSQDFCHFERYQG
eukprot:Clim_evm15s247 gene=Clim_evmTU15s247